jgi:hypothetical protein
VTKTKRIKAPKDWEDPPDSFERFKSLAQGLMAVSKKELDKEQAKREKPKQKKPHE